MIAECDVLIVGAGIVGLAHAAEAHRRGLSVVVIDRDSHAVGASVRNFGHCCITAQTGELLELAHVARERWLYFSGEAGFFAVQSGALAVARSAEELAVLDELSASREAGEVRLVRASEALDLLDVNLLGVNGESTGDTAPILGGAVLRDDLRVDPRQAVAALAGWLAVQPGVTFVWRTAYFGGESAALSNVAATTEGAATSSGAAASAAATGATEGGELQRTSRGVIRAARTIVCVGHDLDYLFPEVAEAFGVERCVLQMARIEAPGGRRIAPAVLTGTSMLRYPAFASTDAAGALRAAALAGHPELVDIGANVMFTQRPDGTIIVGDSHAYGPTAAPFMAEQTTEVLLRHIGDVLGVPEVRVVERWQGIYASSARQPYVVTEVAPNVTAVSITSGVGMTISFGVAARTFESLG
ncbi:oxidoreductase [Subtercola lobariae]|uniref:Oxidoreductase n=1 Tax=Subtercola lobariae TaxID=1588641 RepID=A0A917EV86_9MICO|nr:oxidoreductase [Subtercola lobariae]